MASGEQDNQPVGSPPPKIYRVMYKDGDRPAVGTGKSMLGVRAGEIKPDKNGDVHPQPKGMSVFVCPCQIVKSIVPARLQAVNPKLFRGAIGDDDTFLWRMGGGPLEPGPLTEDLTLEADLRPERAGRHATVGPRRTMTLVDYEGALAATQESWNKDEQRNSACPFCED